MVCGDLGYGVTSMSLQIDALDFVVGANAAEEFVEEQEEVVVYLVGLVVGDMKDRGTSVTEEELKVMLAALESACGCQELV